MKITASLVTYNNSSEDIKKVIESVLATKLDITFYISDNSETDKIRELCTDSRIKYIFNNCNKGFGAGHNIAIKLAEVENSIYHFIINPDIFFKKNNLEKMLAFMEKNSNVGLLMPKILYPNGELQYVCKLLPTPFNLFSRGFLPSWKWVKKINDTFEMRFTEYKDTMIVPYISGCFMLFRTSVFSEIGYFDENIFMYLEETDIARRVGKKYLTVMYPEAQVFHVWEKGTHKNKKLRNITIQSSIYYFNKYGWIFDSERKKINNEIRKNWKYIG